MTRVLLVEPDKKLSAVYSEALQAEGYIIDVAAHAQEAIHAADAALPDLIVLELRLAAHNGVEFLYELRSYPEWQAIPVVLLTFIGPDALQLQPEHMRLLGIAHCLYKPATSLRQLRRTLRETLETSGSMRSAEVA